MQKILIVVLMACISFAIEFMIFNLFGRIFLPNLSLILVVFVNLSLGIRYGLVVAFLTGIFKDSLGVGFFGIHLMSYIACAFLAALLQKYIYQRGSMFFRFVLMVLVLLSDFLIQFFLNLISGEVALGQAIRYILFPELVMTLLITNICFDQLKKCVLKYLV